MGEAPPDRTGLVLVERYKITGVLGSGAMADVYEAVDLHSNVAVAVKLLNEDVRDRSAYHDRFEREALITAKFRHPTCIRILDYGNTEDGLPFQVMEIVRGLQLADILDAEERLAPTRALHIFKQLLYALAECGDAGVIHRDVKPENLLVYPSEGMSDAVKLIDFGIAKLIGDAAVGHEKLTSVGLILGTPHYIAPEWVTSDDVDCRADLYSATIMLFEMLTSAPPFLSEDRKALMKMHLNDEPPTLRERIPDENFSDELEAMVRKGLAKNPEDRFASAREYLKALNALGLDALVAPPPHSPNLAPAAVGYLSEPVVGGPRHRGVANHAPPPKRVSPLVFAGIGLAVAGLIAVLALLNTGDDASPPTFDAGATSASEFDAGNGVASKGSDAGAKKPKPDPKPDVPVVPIDDAQVAQVTGAFEAAGFKTSGFKTDLDDKLANGACRYGKVDKLRVIVCLAAHDPAKSSKSVSRPSPGDKSPRKWRPSLERGEFSLRVQSEGKNKKRKRLRRKIESTFKKL